MVKLFLEEGVEVNFENRDGWTALMKAVEGYKVEVVKLLLDNGAIDSYKRRGGCALTMACRQGIVKALLPTGAQAIKQIKFEASPNPYGQHCWQYQYAISPVNEAVKNGHTS